MNYTDGTKQSGFVRAGQNKEPRNCGNCIWYGLSSCGHPNVVTDPEMPILDNGRARVDEDDCCNGMQSRGNVVIYCVRHGTTDANNKNEFRGWMDIPLDAKGKQQAKLAGKYIQDHTVKAVYTSDLDRAVETAALAFPHLDAEKDPNLKPWNIGVYSGKSRDLNQEKLNWYIDNPEVEVPDGESLKAFADRMKKAFEHYADEGKKHGPVAVVFHSSNIIQFEKQSENKDELGRPEDVELVTPGGILAILEEEGEYKAEPIFGDKGSANYGS